MSSDLNNFIDDFNIIDNAFAMRTLMRWNGRDLRNRENLAEHTHLVVACAIRLYDVFKDEVILDFERLVKRCMLHDSLELLRGDILSITKDVVPGLRQYTDTEENLFMDKFVHCTPAEEEICTLADLMACYKYVENELKYPCNDFAIQVYKDTKDKFDKAYKDFLDKYGIVQPVSPTYKPDFVKGYEDDAGSDIILSEKVTIMPMTTTTINLHIKATPKEGQMGFLCSRTSAAKRGLITAMCPIDPNYTGDVLAIVHNVSNQIIEYEPGQSFCQIVFVPFENVVNATVTKQGKRTTGNLGSTGRS